MNSGRILSAMICASLIVSSMPAVPVIAENSKAAENENAETTAMRAAIRDIKKRINIPKELDKFDYDSVTKYEVTYYKFTWYREEYDEKYDRYYTVESITAEYYKGFISSYSYRNNDSGGGSSKKPSFSKLTADEQNALAKKYLYQLNPDLKGNAVIIRNSSEKSLFGNTVNYSISRIENGIDFGDNYGSISIDRDTGNLLSYSLKWWSGAVFPDASKRLSVEKVSEIYASRKPLKAYYNLYYRSKYDKQAKEYIQEPFVLAVYAPSVSGENEIDALTGKYTSYYDDKEKYSYTDAYTWYSYYNDEYDEYYDDYEDAYEPEYDFEEEELTEAEKAALEKENGYLSFDDALKIIKEDEFIVFNKELILKSNTISSYTDDNGEIQTMRELKFVFTTEDDTKDSIYLNVNLDAYTGRIINFDKSYVYGSNSPNKNTKNVEKKASLNIAKKAAEHFIGKKADEYRYNNNWSYTSRKYTYTECRLGYTRYVNDLPASFDSMSICVDSRGEVLGFDHKYHEVEFPAANLMPESKVYEKLFKHMKPELYYRGFTDLKLDPHVYLTYEFESSYIINAVTGERITYSGAPYYIAAKEEKPKKAPELYTDIKGHRYEKEITELWNYGIRITEDEKLDPDSPITIEEFFDLCGSAGFSSYECYIYPNITKFDEQEQKEIYVKNPMLEKKLTYGELAKIYVYMYTDDCYGAAGIKGIFSPPYKNVSKDNKNCGYIAVAKAKGLIADGKEFPYNRTVTRANCLKAFYDYIAGDDEKDLNEIIRI